MTNLASLRLLLQAVSLLLCSLTLALAEDLPGEPILRIDPGEHTASITRIATDDAGRYLVTASHDKTARVWNLEDGRLLRTLRIPIGSGKEGSLSAVALSPDGQTVALGGWSRLGGSSNSIFLLDRASGRILRRLPGLPEVILHLAFSPDGRTLAASLGSHYGLRLFSVDDGRLLAEDRDYADSSYSVHFSQSVAGRAEGHLVTTCLDGFLRLYRFKGDRLTLLVKRAAPGGQNPDAARFSPDGMRIAVSFQDSPAVNVLNTRELSLDYAPDTAEVNDALLSIAWSRQGDFLYAAGRAYKEFEGRPQIYIRRWPAHGNGKFSDWSVAGNTIMDLAALSGGRLVFGSGEPSWGIVNAEGRRTLFHAPMAVDFSTIHEGFTLSADGARIRFGYEYGGQSPAVFDSQNHTFLPPNTAGLIPPALAASGLNVTDWDTNSDTPPRLNGEPLTLGAYEISRSLALLPQGEGFTLGTEWWLRNFDGNGNQRWRQLAPGSVWDVNASQDGRWVVAAYGDGTIRWHRASDGVEQLAFYPHPDKKRWVMWTPSGYYDASPGAEDLIGWHINRGKDQAADFFPASRFRERFYRPDVLRKILATRDESEALRLANAESGRRTQAVTPIAQVLPPVVEIVSPAPDTVVQSDTVKVRYTVRTAADAPVTAMRVRVNGLLQSGTRALKLAGSSGDAQEIEVTLPEQDAEIQLFAENKYSISTPAALHLKRAGNATGKQIKPNLYVLAVGVSKYKKPEYNLGLAAKDAQDFVNSLANQKGKLYGDVVVKLLTDDKATKDEVLDGLDWLRQQVTSHDMGIMFVAGHGMNDKLGNYYFMPHNADPEKLARTGVSQNDIKQTFASLPGHTVFFIDTCYSGGVMGSVRTSRLVNELASAENGAVVFAAASAGQLSQENPDWGNGAFTKSVVEGLNGSADFRKSGFITAKGLDYYVDDRVKTLTNGQQTPVSISPSGVSDFQIAAVVKK